MVANAIFHCLRMSSYTMSSTLVFTKMSIKLYSSPLDGDEERDRRKYWIHYPKYYIFYNIILIAQYRSLHVWTCIKSRIIKS